MEPKTFGSIHYSSEKYVETFPQFLRDSPQCRHFSPEEFNRIDRALEIARDFHVGEYRTISQGLVIDDLIILVKEEFKKNPNIVSESTITYDNIITLLLYKTIKKHPKRYLEILDFVGMEIFCRILKLSNLSRSDRYMIYDFLSTKIDIHSHDAAILDMLSYEPNDTKEYKHDISEDNKSKYKNYLLQCNASLDEYYPDISGDAKIAKLNGLFNYIFFDPIDARNRLSIILHNFKDVNIIDSMNKMKYKRGRIPKFHALATILQSLGMLQELQELKRQWAVVGGYSDEENNFFVNIQSNPRLIESVGKSINTVIQNTPPEGDVISI